MTGPYLATSEAAKQIGIAASTLKRWAREGTVEPTVRTPGGHYRWDLDDLRRQLAGHHEDHETGPARPGATS